MISQAAPAAHASQPSAGLFMLAWGLFASAIGLSLVTNFRGFADNFTKNAHASSAGLRKFPPWKWQRRSEDLVGRTRMVRLIAIPFAVLGPIMTVAGIIAICHGHISMPNEPALPIPFRCLVIVLALLSVGQYWLPRGFFRAAARQGRWRRAVVMLASVGAIVFGVSVASGFITIGVVAWLLSGLPLMPLLMERRRAATEPDDASRRTTGYTGSGR